MKKLTLFIILMALSIAPAAHAGVLISSQGTGSGGSGVVAYTVATLPGTPADGDFAIVTDGLNAADCTVGGGVVLNPCIYDTGGAAWVIGGDGAGSGSAFTTHATPAGTSPVAVGAGTLTWDDTAPIVITGNSTTDTITVSITDATTSAKGAAQFDSGDFSVTSGVVTLAAAYEIILDDVDIAADNISAAQASRGVTITNDGKGAAADYNLPAAVAGMVVYVFAEEAQNIVLDTDILDKIVMLDGTALDNGDSIISDGNASSWVKLKAHDAATWFIHSQVGVWTDNGV